MRHAIILLALWLLVSAFWVQFVHSAWRDAVDRNLAQIAAIDRLTPLLQRRVEVGASSPAETGRAATAQPFVGPNGTPVLAPAT